MNDLVDIAGLGGQKQDAKHGAGALHRDGDGNDQLALFRAADNCATYTGECVHHLGIDGTVAAGGFLIDRQVGRLQHLVEKPAEPVRPTLDFVVDRRQIVAQYLAARIEMTRIQQQVGIGIENASPGAGRRNKPPQHRCYLFRIDRELQVIVVGRRRDALAGLQLE